jgi:small-conductance mechanosensitive channel
VKSPTVPNISINPTVLEVILALGFVALAYAASAVMGFVLERLSARFPARRLFFKRLQPIPQIGVYVFAGYVLIKILSPDQSSLYAILGSMALALGLAAQSLLKDIIGGIVVLIDKSFQIGDRIRVGNFYGEVASIGLRSTKILTPTQTLVTIPNSRILNDGASSINAGAVDCLVTTHVYLPGEIDFTVIEHMARDAVLTSKLARLDKPITVLSKDESQRGNLLHVEIRAYVFDMRYEEMLATDLTRRIKKALAWRDKDKKDKQGEPSEPIDDKINAAVAEHLLALGRRFAQPNGSALRDVHR